MDGLDLQVALDGAGVGVPLVGDVFEVAPWFGGAPYRVRVVAVGGDATAVWLATDGAHLMARRGVGVVVVAVA